MRTTKVLLLSAICAVLIVGFSACGQQGGGQDAAKSAEEAEKYSSRAAMLGGPGVEPELHTVAERPRADDGDERDEAADVALAPRSPDGTREKRRDQADAEEG